MIESNKPVILEELYIEDVNGSFQLVKLRHGKDLVWDVDQAIANKNKNAQEQEEEE